MKWLLTVVILSLLLFVQCGNQLSIAPSETDYIIGKWEETFNFYWLADQVHPAEGNGFAATERTSTLSLSEDHFILRIHPPRRAFVFEPDTFYVGWADDTLFTGVYEIRQDSLLMNLAGSDRFERFTFSMEENRLRISAAGELDSNGQMAFPLSSFLWAYSFFKGSGEFIRVE
jgi:hypothetical protein